MNKKILIPLLLVAVAAAAYFGGTYLVGREKGEEGTLTLYGNVDIREVALSFRVGGRLAEMAFQEGDRVAAGETVALLDDSTYRDQLAVAEAGLERAKAQLALLEAGARPQEIRQARARVAEAQAAFDNASQEATRKAGLVDSGGASQRELEAAQARRQQTAAQLEATRQALALAEEGFRSEEIEAARAEVRLAEAQLEQARTALADTQLAAPSDGVILTRVVEPGSLLAAGAPVYSLSLTAPVYVRAYVSEPQLGLVAPGDEVTLTSDSSEHRYRGQVGFVSPRAEFTPKSVETPQLRTDLVYRLRIVVLDPDDGLRQGMPITVQVPVVGGQES